MKSSSRRSNRTGLSTSPALAREIIQGTQLMPPSSEGGAQAIAVVRIAYSKNAEPVGSMPPPDSEAGSRKASAVPPVFLDKLGERLAFERSGVRLYDALLSKFDAFGTWKNGPSREDLEEIRKDELSHFAMLRQVVTKLGADPTAVTPSANVHGVASKGLPAVLADPRTNLWECLEAVLVAELVDNDCWENLSDLAVAIGEDDLARMFQDALSEERDHLRRVRTWLGAALSQSATGEVDGAFHRRAQERERRPTERRPTVTAKRPAATRGKRVTAKAKRSGTNGRPKKTGKSRARAGARRARAS
jgi:rubrerythrin